MSRQSISVQRLAALSMLETLDNDAVIGTHGELSRWQIMPDVRRKYRLSDAAAQNPKQALRVVRSELQRRCQDFATQHHRQPTDFEFYVLWNAPAQVGKPSPAVAERAQRFANLCAVDLGRKPRFYAFVPQPSTPQNT